MAIDRRPESLFSILKSLAEFTLMVFGIIGIAVQVFHEQGLLKTLFNNLVNEALSTSLATIFISGLVLVLGKLWFDRVFAKAENAKLLGDLLMRGMMLLGVFFLIHFVTTGSFKI